MENLKFTQFQPSTEAPILIRTRYLNGRCVAFGLPGDLLSLLLVSQERIDFDAESEQILEKLKNTDQNRFFEYSENWFLPVSNPQWFNIPKTAPTRT